MTHIWWKKMSRYTSTQWSYIVQRNNQMIYLFVWTLELPPEHIVVVLILFQMFTGTHFKVAQLRGTGVINSNQYRFTKTGDGHYDVEYNGQRYNSLYHVPHMNIVSIYIWKTCTPIATGEHSNWSHQHNICQKCN